MIEEILTQVILLYANNVLNLIYLRTTAAVKYKGVEKITFLCLYAFAYSHFLSIFT